MTTFVHNVKIKFSTHVRKSIFRLKLKPIGEAITKIINFKSSGSRAYFTLIVRLLGRIYSLLTNNATCTKR